MKIPKQNETIAKSWNLDRNRWNTKTPLLIVTKTYALGCRKLVMMNLVSHRFVTPDHKVQESNFSSGNSIVVNFGDEDFVFEGNVIKAKSFIALTN